MRNNSEGNVYKVQWEKLSSGYSAWLSRVPKLKVAGKDEQELSEELFEITMDRFGDGEPCFDFYPPLPIKATKKNYFEPEWFTLSCNEGFRTVGDRAKLYSEGLCSYCGAGSGERTPVSRVIDGVLKGDMAVLWGERRTVFITSEKFAKFFGRLLDSQMRKVDCLSDKKNNKTFYELVLTPKIPLVVHKDAAGKKSYFCPSCKSKPTGYFACPSVARGLFLAIERRNLTRLKHKAIVAGDFTANICVNAQVAKQLKTKSGLKGVLLDRLMLLNQQNIGEYDLVKADKVRR